MKFESRSSGGVQGVRPRPAMLTPKRAALVAVFLLLLFYFLQSSSDPPPVTATIHPTTTPNRLKSDHEAPSPKTTSSPESVALTRPYPPPKLVSTGRKEPQRPLAEVVTRNIRDQLAFQFEYDRQGKFPAYIWQTWKYLPSESDFQESFRPAESSWTDLHPGFVHEVVNDQNALSLVKLLYASVPDVVEAYESLPLPVMKADLFRYLILLARGGIYSDIDTSALKSATEWLPDDIPRSTVGLVIGIEADPDREDWKDWFSRRIQFCQWTIQAKPGHPVLRDIVAKVVEKTLEMKRKGTLTPKKVDKKIVEITGPAIWTDSVFDYMNDPKYFNVKDDHNVTWEAFTGIESAKKIGDVVVLPITSFSPGVQQMGAKEPDDPMAFVHHEFEGTWKPESERIHPERDRGLEQEGDR